MKLLKILFSIVLLFVLVGVLAIVSLIYYIDPNKLKPVLVEEVKLNTGYQLVVDGNLSWSFYPHLGVKIDHMTLKAPYQPVPFIDLRDVRIATELSELLQGKQKLRGKLTIEQIALMNLHIKNVSADLHWENNILTLQPIYASLYDGALTGIVHGRHLSTVPEWDFQGEFNGLQLKPLLRDMSGKDNKLIVAGKGYVKIQFATQGKERDQLLNNLHGAGEFKVTNGVVDGIDLNYLVQTADALINKQPVSEPANINQTVFSSLTGTFTMSNGMAKTENTLLVSPVFTAQTAGNIALNTEEVDLKLLVKAEEILKTQWEVPVLVTGNLRHPSVRLDMVEIEEMLAKRGLTKLKEKASEEIKKHVPGKAGEVLQNLLGK